MKRFILDQLIAWKQSPYRKPLMLKGARQVGKTWILNEFGKESYKNVAYLSLENIAPGKPSEFTQIFETTTDPHRIVEQLKIALGTPITPQETLLILDEIQDCPAAIHSLKYFCENASEYHVACAGSLLEVYLENESSFPVGKVNFLNMHPMSFSEYLVADKASDLQVYCSQIDTFDSIPDVIANQLIEKLQAYFVCGGMPEATKRWIDTGDINETQHVLQDLNNSYERDFAKHGGKEGFAKLSLIWHSLPTQLARENKKFLYGLVKTGARAREYEDALQWLVESELIAKVNRSAKPNLPLSAYDDLNAFKLYCLDIGILHTLANISPVIFAKKSNIFTEFKGSFAENYVLNSLSTQTCCNLRYWTNANPPHEVDFLYQVDNTIVPIEVKSGENITSKSLRYYVKKYPDATPVRVRFSLRNLSFNSGLLNIPLYLVDETTRLIRLALQQ